jgi:hypothetical protein
MLALSADCTSSASEHRHLILRRGLHRRILPGNIVVLVVAVIPGDRCLQGWKQRLFATSSHVSTTAG